MAEIIINDVKFTNVPNKKAGTKFASALTQSNIGMSQAVQDYVNSDYFYTLVNAIDINWDGIDVGEENIYLNTTSDLIKWIKAKTNIDLSDYATTTYVNQKIEDLIGGAPETLDTLKELADALQNDATLAYVTEALDGKADKSSLDDYATVSYVTTEIANISLTPGATGPAGQDGVTPHIDSDSGNWFIGTTDTGVHAQGPEGIQGLTGPEGPQGPAGANGKDLVNVEYSLEPLTIESLEDNNIIRWECGQYVYDNGKTISYSKDKENWTDAKAAASTSAPILSILKKGEKLYIKGTNNRYPNENSLSQLRVCYFTSTKNVNVSGNIMSLKNGWTVRIDGSINIDETMNSTNKYIFARLFYGLKIISAENLILPTTTLVEGCYGCMFSSCTLLTKAPKLPATTLATKCYHEMFSGCLKLREAPELPVLTLATECYGYMFDNCQTLSKAPLLAAPTLVEGCYEGMFENCYALNCVQMLATDVSATNCLQNWLKMYNVPEYGGIIIISGKVTMPEGTVPSNATVLTYTPELKTVNNESIIGSGNIEISGGSSNIADLDDVTVNDAQNGQVLTYNNGNWGNAGITLPDMSNYVTYSDANTYYVDITSYNNLVAQVAELAYLISYYHPAPVLQPFPGELVNSSVTVTKTSDTSAEYTTQRVELVKWDANECGAGTENFTATIDVPNGLVNNKGVGYDSGYQVFGADIVIPINAEAGTYTVTIVYTGSDYSTNTWTLTVNYVTSKPQFSAETDSEGATIDFQNFPNGNYEGKDGYACYKQMKICQYNFDDNPNYNDFDINDFEMTGSSTYFTFDNKVGIDFGGSKGVYCDVHFPSFSYMNGNYTLTGHFKGDENYAENSWTQPFVIQNATDVAPEPVLKPAPGYNVVYDDTKAAVPQNQQGQYEVTVTAGDRGIIKINPDPGWDWSMDASGAGQDSDKFEYDSDNGLLNIRANRGLAPGNTYQISINRSEDSTYRETHLIMNVTIAAAESDFCWTKKSMIVNPDHYGFGVYIYNNTEYSNIEYSSANTSICSVQDFSWDDTNKVCIYYEGPGMTTVTATLKDSNDNVITTATIDVTSYGASSAEWRYNNQTLVRDNDQYQVYLNTGDFTKSFTFASTPNTGWTFSDPQNAGITVNSLTGEVTVTPSQMQTTWAPICINASYSYSYPYWNKTETLAINIGSGKAHVDNDWMSNNTYVDRVAGVLDTTSTNITATFIGNPSDNWTFTVPSYEGITVNNNVLSIDMAAIASDNMNSGTYKVYASRPEDSTYMQTTSYLDVQILPILSNIDFYGDKEVVNLIDDHSSDTVYMVNNLSDVENIYIVTSDDAVCGVGREGSEIHIYREGDKTGTSEVQIQAKDYGGKLIASWTVTVNSIINNNE